MFKKLSYILLFFLLIFTGLISGAQSLRILSTKDGLPQSFISGLVQDDNGFMWISTRGGLTRYDGINFKLFQHNIRDSSTIASNLIIGIKKGAGNKLWIEYESGAIDLFDLKTEQLEHFSKNYLFGNTVVKFFRRAWTVDKGSAFWAIDQSQELVNINIISKQANRYTYLNNLHQTNVLLGLLADRKNELWVLTGSGLCALNKATGKFTVYPTPVPQQFSNDVNREVVGLYERANGELMWGDQKQLFFFNPGLKTYRVVALPRVSATGVRYICAGPDQSEYFESDGEIFHSNDQRGVSLVLRPDGDWSLNIRSFLADRSGLIWIGTNAGGIRLLDLTAPLFQSFSYETGFFQDLMKKQFSLSLSEMFDWQAADGKSSAPGYLFRSAYDRQGRLWMALKQTVGYYDKGRQSFVKLPRVFSGNLSLANQIIIRGFTITTDGQIMVICSNGQILYYDAKTKQWLSFIADNAIQAAFGPAVLPLDIFNDEDNVWITTENSGLIYLDVKTRQLHRLIYDTKAGGLPANQLLALKADPTRRDYLWIGSYQGLICLNKKTLKCETFTLDDGLPDNTIYSIDMDKLGYLWLSTNKGLCRFEPITHKIKIFQTAYGLPGDEFNRFHQLRLPNGQFAFGGPDGWVMFNPLAVKDDNFNPDIAFTNLKINNISVSARRGDVLFKSPLNAVNKLTLSYGQNTVAFEFAGLQFNQPNELSYRYQLTGYDDGWVLAGHVPVANYTKIPPGTYTFKANASNTAGKWSNHIKTVTIVIGAPWWRTWWAILCYCILIALLVWSYIRYSIRMKLLDHEVQLKANEAAQLKKLNEVKTRFFANITHEFRTPLTLILGPAERLKEKYKTDGQGHELAETIENNAGHLLQLINQLMELAKLEANVIKIDQVWGSPAVIIAKVINSFVNEAATKHLLLQFNNGLAGATYWFSPDLLERIVYNLVSNSVKFTPPGGVINVNFDPEQAGVKLVVTDTGIGIPADDLSYIFDRFYQSRNSINSNQNSNKGTGIGLALVKELVEAQGGNIGVQSSVMPPAGTTFNVLLPYRKDEELNNKTTYEEYEEDTVAISTTEGREEILVVEDNAELAAFITTSIAGYYKVKHAPNGLKGAEIAFSEMPDLVISDVLMDGMDGFELCALLKQDVRTSHIPVILLTAVTEQKSKLEGLTQGADDYLTKPFYVPELLLRIRNQLNRQQKLRDYVARELALLAPVNADEESIPQHALVAQLYNIIELHLDDSLFGVDQLIAVVNMSRTTLHRKVKALSGMSTSQFIRNYRLKRAAQFLQQDFNSSDVAYKTGFSSPAYFSKCFRELYGITPVEFSRKV
ncbi:ATP-binding protein [Mucilaginibacter sp. SMC90]|uniref:hybrid sensor histidine kinase/response regulator transcription factor n=1 Tax=Mucilaginibacter sp. SMC90 TaxID=2929803 RepID=UPI001FB37300|nr:ATP-binding protein [Mucilaginibacter sp. SMC90]UOE47254.1 ATP-binding protein [Mucilaginibacter sp. SMC90]